MTAEQRASTAAAPDLVVDSATGVDVTLRIAGPGARAYAFLIDWHIRVILALAWYEVAVRIYSGRWTLSPPVEGENSFVGLTLVPPVLIFFLYHYVLEIAMRGRTPGKRMAGVRVVTREGSAPGVGALLVRNIFRLIDSFPFLYSIGLFATMLTPNHVRIGDMAAGTLLVYDRTGEPMPILVQGKGLDATSAEVLSELLQRWPTMDPRARRRIARTLLSRHGVTPANTTTADEDALLLSMLKQLAGSNTP